MSGGFFQMLGPDGPRWRQLMTRRRFSRDEVVMHEGEVGDTLHVIEKGRVLIEATTAAGDVAVLSVRGPGEVIGELAIVGDGRRTAKVTALEPAETLSLNHGMLDRFRAEDPRVDRFLVAMLADKLGEATNQLMEVLFLPVETRVMRVVARMADVFDRGDGSPVIVKLRQEDVAAMAGTRRQTANPPLREAEAAGAIKLGRGKIEILDRALVDELAE